MAVPYFPDVTPAQWEGALADALESPPRFVVQEYRALPLERFPVFEDGNFKGFESLPANLSCWVHDGSFVGCFVRAARRRIVNVHQGGGLMPALFLI